MDGEIDHHYHHLYLPSLPLAIPRPAAGIGGCLLTFHQTHLSSPCTHLAPPVCPSVRLCISPPFSLRLRLQVQLPAGSTDMATTRPQVRSIDASKLMLKRRGGAGAVSSKAREQRRLVPKVGEGWKVCNVHGRDVDVGVVSGPWWMEVNGRK